MANPSRTSPVGRFVQGDAFEPQTTDKTGAPLTVKSGPNKGQPTKRWFMAVAYPKSDPLTLPYLQKFGEEARAAFPALFAAYNPNTPPIFGCSMPKFSTKIMDGDGVDHDSKSNAAKPGFAGHWIVKYTTSIQAPEVYHAGKYDPMERVTDARELPRGFYVRIFGNTDSNGADGMYVNHSKVEIVRPGDVIVSGPSAADAFGAAAGAVIPPVPPTPPAPALTGDMLVPTNKDGLTIAALQAAGWTDEQMIAGGYATRPVAAPPVPPTPPAPPAPPAPPTPPAPPATGGAPAGFKMGPAAGQFTYQSFIDKGWTQETLLSAGMIVPQ